MFEFKDEINITDQTIHWLNIFVQFWEFIAAVIFVLLFAIGVIDLGRVIVEWLLRNQLTAPQLIISIIETGLLLLIILEVYQTVIAQIYHTDAHQIARLVVYAGVIAMVRKLIIFQADDFITMQSSLLAATAYTVLILGFGGLLLAGQVPKNDVYKSP